MAAAPCPPPHPPRRREAGYNLVILMVLVTALNVLVAAALPAWSGWDRRQKEEELIFRGLQYAEAIRVFQARFGRLPVRLEELVEVEPRSIRQLWTDPITGEESWGLIFANAGGGGNSVPGQGPGQGPGGDLTGDSGLSSGFDDDRQDTRARSGDPNRVTQGPIVGVYSLADGDSIKTFNGKQTYSEWHFTVDVLLQGTGMAGGAPTPPQPGPGDDDGRRQGRQGGQPAPPGVPGALVQPGMGPPDLSARWVGRPWPPELETQMAAAGQLGQGGLPGGGPAGGAGGVGAGGAGGPGGGPGGGQGGGLDGQEP